MHPGSSLRVFILIYPTDVNSTIEQNEMKTEEEVSCSPLTNSVCSLLSVQLLAVIEHS